jgi:hypothetical protein
VKLVGILRNLPFYNYAKYIYKTTELRAKGVDNRVLLIGNPVLPLLFCRMLLVEITGTRYILFK